MKVIRKRIHALWGAKPLPKTISTEPIDFEGEDERYFLTGRNFDALTESNWINVGMPFLGSLTSEAESYFLGGYLLRVLDNLSQPGPSGICADRAIIGLTFFVLDQARSEPALAILSAEEKGVVADVLALLVENSTLFLLEDEEVRGLTLRAGELRSVER